MERNAELDYARSQSAYWQGGVRELEKTDADRRREAKAREFLAVHAVVVKGPRNLIPPRFVVDGEELGESRFIEMCSLCRVCPGTVYQLAAEQ